MSWPTLYVGLRFRGESLAWATHSWEAQKPVWVSTFCLAVVPLGDGHNDTRETNWEWLRARWEALRPNGKSSKAAAA